MKIPININSGEIKKETTPSIIVGIDLGTTNSLVAYIIDKKPTTVTDQNGKNSLVPSIVHFSKDGKIIVGEKAKSFLINEPNQTIYSVKRLMGKSYEDLTSRGYQLGYKVIDDKNNDNQLVKIKVNDKFYSPIQLSAEILKELKSRAEEELKISVEKAVITVPAYFNDAQRQATRDAGKLAGLDVLRIVNEPTAASLAYGIGLDPDEEKLIAVYDLGGGTFDISILQIQQGIFEVLSTHGDTFLGGDDFDNAIVKYWIDEHNISERDLENDPSIQQELRNTAEEAKKYLSKNDEFQKNVGSYDLKIDLDTFNQLVQLLVEKTIESCKQAIQDAEISIKDIDSVVMVGGSTRVPLVKNTVKDFFGQEVNDTMDPDEVVALGAAIQADILAGNRKDILLLDITPLSLGIETVGGLMDTIIPRNSKVPIRAGRNYTTSVDGQTNLKVAVYQGERDLVSDNRKIGEFILKGIPPMAAGIPKIEIKFILDADGILTVKAEEQRSSTQTQVQIRSTYGVTEEEMAKMLIDSLQNAEGDMKKRSLLEAVNEANNIIHSTEKFIKQNEEILSKDEKKNLNLLKESLKKSTEQEDKDVINLAMDELNQYSEPIAHRVLDVNIGNALKEKNIHEKEI